MRHARANNAKAMKAERKVECHLGDVPGGLEPTVYPPHRDMFVEDQGGGFVEWLKHDLPAWIAAFIVISGMVLAVWLLLQLVSQPSLAHGPAEWIQRGGYKNAAGELCCGERDCFELTDADVKVTPDGYFVVSTKETIPFSEATPSPDGRYWRCQWGGSRKCFFAPPGST